jgi:hypothetical protein
MAAEGDPVVGGLLGGPALLRVCGLELLDNGEFVRTNRVETVNPPVSGGGVVENIVGHVCNDEMAAVQVAESRVKAESEIYFGMRTDYTGEEWRLLFLSTSSENYKKSLKLLGYCSVDGVLWALVTRIQAVANAPFVQYESVFPRSCRALLHYMRPQFRFLVYIGENDINPGVSIVTDIEGIVAGDANIWGAPISVDGIPLAPEVECLVPFFLRSEFRLKTFLMSFHEDDAYTCPGVMKPTLMPSEYIRKFFFFTDIYLVIFVGGA